MSCGCGDHAQAPAPVAPVASARQIAQSTAALVLSRNDMFPEGKMPESGVGSMTVKSLSDTVVLHHTIDVRARETFLFSDAEVAQIITGLLSEQSFAPHERVTVAQDSELLGTYRMSFPDHDDVVGDVRAIVRQRGRRMAPSGCCGEQCGCRRSTHVTQAAVMLGSPRADEQVLVPVVRTETDCEDCPPA